MTKPLLVQTSRWNCTATKVSGGCSSQHRSHQRCCRHWKHGIQVFVLKCLMHDPHGNFFTFITLHFAEIIQRMLASLAVRPHVPRLDILFSRSTSLSQCTWQRQISTPTSHRIQDTSTYMRDSNQKQTLNCKI